MFKKRNIRGNNIRHKQAMEGGGIVDGTTATEEEEGSVSARVLEMKEEQQDRKRYI